MSSNTLLLLLTASLISLNATAWGQPSQVDVMDYGAKGDGVTDDTPAFAAAMAAVAEKGGTVSVPVGNYMIKTHLNIPSKVTLEGVWKIPTAFAQMTGSTLLAVEGAGSENGTPFITIGMNSALKGMIVYYPDQKPDDITPYPWCVACAGGDNSSIIDCLLVNPYQGVDFSSNASGRHYIRNLYGQPLRRGISVDKCYDVGRIENVHFWPFWKWDEESGIRDWLWKNGEAMIFARTDWEYVFNFFCFGYGIGMRFIAGKDGPCNGNFLGCGIDAAEIAVLVEQTQPPGLLFTNGEFVSFAGDKPCEIVVKDSHTGVVQFSNCSYWGTSDQIARIAGTGQVSFNGCNFLGWDRKTNKTPAIELFGGDLIVNGCNFRGAGPQVALRGKSKSAIVTSNRMGGPMSITNPVNAQLEAGFNICERSPEHPAEEKGAIVVDDADGPPAVKLAGEWLGAQNSGEAQIGYFLGTRWAWKGVGDATAVFTPDVPADGKYTVYAWFGPDPASDHARNAPVIIQSADDRQTLLIDLRETRGEWMSLGTYRFQAGRKGSITFSNDADGNVLADAVKLVPAS
jgi:hypothetical protein